MNVLQRALIALESFPDPSANDLALITEVRTLEENLRLSGYFSRPERAGAQDAADLDILSEEHL